MYKPEKEPKTTKKNRCEYASRKYKELVECRSTACIITVESKKDVYVSAVSSDSAKSEDSISPVTKSSLSFDQCPADDDDSQTVEHNPDEACTVEDILVDEDIEFDGQNPVDIQFQLRKKNEIELNEIRECHKMKMLRLMEKEIELEMKMNQIREEHKRKFIELIKEENDAEFKHAKRMRDLNLS